LAWGIDWVRRETELGIDYWFVASFSARGEIRDFFKHCVILHKTFGISRFSK
jgi:hypothetical protein